jgi:1-aminocyclopropane-1-carboxylate deaminase/D-cysteine desulfhydrase-like pyridoxal-dependent ACC family enzyme
MSSVPLSVSHSSYLQQFDRVGLHWQPTPLRRLPALSRRYGRELWIKRDDWGDFGLAGAKARKLDFILAKVRSLGYRCVVGSGPMTSNSLRALAAASAQIGLDCHLFLCGEMLPEQIRGNPAVSSMFGATLHWATGLSWSLNDMLAESWAKEHGAYRITPGGSEGLGVVGIVAAYMEFVQQCEAQDLAPSGLVHASATGGVSAGLRIGAAWQRSLSGQAAPHIKSIAVVRDLYDGDMNQAYESVANEALEMLDLAACLPLDLSFDYVGETYGVITEQARCAAREFARSEGILLDGFYVGRAAAAMLDLAKQGGGPLVLWHTGGTQSLLDQTMTDELWQLGAPAYDIA